MHFLIEWKIFINRVTNVECKSELFMADFNSNETYFHSRLASDWYPF